MKTQTKNEVKEALVSTYSSPKEKFNALLAVFLKLDAVSEAQKRYFNAAGFSPNNLAALIYDIKKLCDIKDTELSATKREVAKASTPAPAALTLSEELEIILNATDLEKADYNKEIKPLAKAVSDALGTAPASMKKVDLIAYLVKEREAMYHELRDASKAVSDLFDNFPEEVKVDLKLRDEFPFLNSPDCPDKFKILVADKLTAYNAFKDSRKEIKRLLELGATEEDLYEMALVAVENFELNLEIYDELNYYKEHGEILGKHEIFADDMLNEKVEKFSTVELTKRQKNLRTYISRDSKTLDKMEAGEAKDAFAAKLDEFKTELELIDARLDKIS